MDIPYVFFGVQPLYWVVCTPKFALSNAWRQALPYRLRYDSLQMRQTYAQPKWHACAMGDAAGWSPLGVTPTWWVGKHMRNIAIVPGVCTLPKLYQWLYVYVYIYTYYIASTENIEKTNIYLVQEHEVGRALKAPAFQWSVSNVHVCGITSQHCSWRETKVLLQSPNGLDPLKFLGRLCHPLCVK